MSAGKKQLNVVAALFDADRIANRPLGKYLTRSASAMRATIHPPLNEAHNDIDRFVCLVLGETGPRYCNRGAIGTQLMARHDISTSLHQL